MPRTLPANPNIEWLRKLAKQRLAELRVADFRARLHQAQLEIAREFAFESWRALKAHVDRTSVDGRVFMAVTTGDAARLGALLDAHPDKLHLQTGRWSLPLMHHAADHGQLACVDVLLVRGSDVNGRDRLDNATALHWAAQSGHIAVVRRLIAAGADVDGVGDTHGLGVIGWATCFRRTHADVADLLLAHGAQPHIFAAIALGRAGLVRTLVGTNPDALSLRMSQYEHGRTPLQFAISRNDVHMVVLLLALGADPNATDRHGAAALGHVEPATDPAITAALIDAGANPEERAMSRIQQITPIFVVASVAAAIDYYVNRLGFQLSWEWGSPSTNAGVARDAIEIHLTARERNGRQPGSGSAYVFVTDVDALYAELEERGAKLLNEPKDYPYGMRDFNVNDPDGNELCFGTESRE
jgi:uncharacterized glyoxalase superfamily protein PhnB